MQNNITYDSFQQELEDFIRKQKARGLHPELCFRKEREDSANKRHYPRPTPQKLEQRHTFRKLPELSGLYNNRVTMEGQSPPWHKSDHSRQRLESLHQGQKSRDYFLKSCWLPNPLVRGNTSHLHTKQCREDTDCHWGSHANVYHAEDQGPNQRKRPHEVRGDSDTEEEQYVKHRRKHPHTENRKEAKGELNSTDKPKLRKKSPQEEGRKCHKEKKQSSKKSIQERDLWDEAILGGYY